MPNRCVAGGCSNGPDPSQNIGFYKFPEDNDLEKKRRRLWVAFVGTKRAKWSPTANSRLCSQHFQTEDFESPFVTIPGTDFAVRELLKENVAKTSEAEASTPTTSTTDEFVLEPGLVDDQMVTSDSLYLVQQPLSTEEASCQTPECLGCKKLKSQNRQLCNKIIDLKLKIQDKEAAIQKQKESIDESMAKVAAMEEKLEDETFVNSDEEMDIEEKPDYSEVSSPEPSLASVTESAPEADLSESDLFSDDEEPLVIKTLDNSENLRTEPKFIVFLSQLLLLFNVCPACKSEKPFKFIETSVLGVMVKITTKCFNPDCSSPENTWKNQPIMTAKKMPAMDFLLCFSVLVSGASPSKIFLVFKNIGLSCNSLKTYFKHQAVSIWLYADGELLHSKLFPTVHLYWTKYQEKMMAKLKATGKSLVIAGDGKHDSIGHSAKYFAYTLFCFTVPLNINLSLVQIGIDTHIYVLTVAFSSGK
ncbi:THAP domain-containing 2 [Paramuricea clavata]|uniref:THAP domain-containing 2 n=1 Tax=Paramuricea clavata TaxID=317549 RepID=A0A6S7HBQ7_PARCT|nr:THAP domain-containing 2 [Paramuricea clavata]